MRVPGTINVPDAKKRKRGRTPILAKLVDAETDWSREYSVEELAANLLRPGGSGEDRPAKAPPIAAAGEASISEITWKLIANGDDCDRPIGSADARYRSRSEVLFRVVCELLRSNVGTEKIAEVLLDPTKGISASVLDKPNPKAYAAKQIRSAQEKVGGSWDVDKGRLRATLLNARRAILRLGIECRKDVFRNRLLVGGQVLQSYQGELSDDACAMLRQVILDGFGYDPGKDHVRDAAHALCLENAFDPIVEYLNCLRWDGAPRVDEWLATYLGAEPTKFNCAVGRIMLVAAVRRARKPGTKFDHIVVLEGPQGTGKSSAVTILAGREFFSDQDILTLDAKSQMEALEGVWLFEIPELAGMRGADIEKIKAFASRWEDRARPAYGRFRENHPRRCIFVATTNDEEYLNDPTGNRRFWPVRTEAIDLVALAVDRDQLWAEAAALEARGETIALDPALWPEAEQVQGKRMEEDPWIEMLQSVEGTLINGTYRVSIKELLDEVLHLPADKQYPFVRARARRAMERLGWTYKVVRIGDPVTVRGFERPAPTQGDLPFWKTGAGRYARYACYDVTRQGNSARTPGWRYPPRALVSRGGGP